MLQNKLCRRRYDWDREQVYENIRTAVSLNQLNSKVEPGDPKLYAKIKKHY